MSNQRNRDSDVGGRIEEIRKAEPMQRMQLNPHPDAFYPMYPCCLGPCGEHFVDYKSVVKHVQMEHGVEIDDDHASDERLKSWKCWSPYVTMLVHIASVA
jgi:hypothetical protein